MRRVARTALSLFLLELVALVAFAAPAHGDGAGRVLLLVGRPRRAALEEAVRIELADRAVEVVSDEAPTGDTSEERAHAVAALVAQHAAASALWIEPPVIPGSLPSVSALDAATGQVRYAAMPRPSAQVGPRVFAVVAASLLDELAREAPTAPPPTLEPAPAPPAETPPAETPPPQTAAAVPAATVRVAIRAPVAPPSAEREGPAGVGIDFVPFVGTSLLSGGRGTRWLSLNVLGGLSGRLRGVELSGLVGSVRGDVGGVQLAGIGAISGGDVTGLQLAGIGDVAKGSVDGLQLAGLGTWAGGPVDGAQLAGIGAIARGPLDGVQLAGIASYADGPLEGVQLSGIAGVTRDDLRGVQLSGIVNVAAGNVRGAQLGLINVAGGDVDGVQLGLVNVSRRTTVPIGLVSVMRKGTLELEATTSDGGLLTAAILHGSGPLHVQYRAGGRPFDEPLVQLGFGLGTTLPMGESAFVALDVTGDHLAPTDDVARFGVLSMARVGAGYRLGPRLSVVAGLTYSMLATGRTDGVPVPRGLFASDSDPLGSFHLVTWPGLQAGIRVQ